MSCNPNVPMETKPSEIARQESIAITGIGCRFPRGFMASSMRSPAGKQVDQARVDFYGYRHSH